MMTVLSFILKSLIAVLALPIAVAMTVALYRNLGHVAEMAGRMQFFLYGVVTYVVIHLLFYRPTVFYVFGHEAMHAAVSWLFGGKIKGFKVAKEGGSVTTDKTNMAVQLAPYFVPIYSIIIMVAYFIVVQSYKINGSVFIFLIGFTLAFHIISTMEAMKVKQPDFVQAGYFFSVVVVYLMNIAVISGIFAGLFPSFSMKGVITDTCVMSRDIYLAAIKQVFY